MKRKICVKSMFLGAVIMLIGLAVGAIVSPPLVAQRNGVFDKIQCRELQVLDKHGKKAIHLHTDGVYGNMVGVYDQHGTQAVYLNVNSYEDTISNGIGIYDESGGILLTPTSISAVNQGAFSQFRLSTDMMHNALYIHDKDGSLSVILNNDGIVIFDKDDKDKIGNIKWQAP